VTYLECRLCGHTDAFVREGLVEWKDPEPRRFDSIPRCTDHVLCRARVERDGESWPLKEET